jgi:hypothetical protein
MRHSEESILKVKNLRECESILVTALAHESGGPWVLIKEKKTRGRIFRETVPLRLSLFLS